MTPVFPGRYNNRVKLHVQFEAGDIKVNEVVAGSTAEAVVAAMQQRVAKELGFLKGTVVRAMSPLSFAQEATRRYNSALKANAPIPATCQEFLDYGVRSGFATWVEKGGAA